MTKIYLDSNILIDFVLQREPEATFANNILDEAEAGQFEVYASPLAFSHAHYISRKEIGAKVTIDLLTKLIQIVNLVTLSEDMIRDALILNWEDFEDGIQYECAQQISHLYAIVTNNPRNFRKAIYKVMTAEQFIKTFKATK